FKRKRRHRILGSVWSSAVCSSDLAVGPNVPPSQNRSVCKSERSSVLLRVALPSPPPPNQLAASAAGLVEAGRATTVLRGINRLRSEERRVGKEGRSWG